MDLNKLSIREKIGQRFIFGINDNNIDVTSIGIDAFSDCSGLTSIVIPDSVTSIGEWAFSDCGLKEIRIPKGTRDKFCAMPELKKYENLLVEYKKEEKEKCATPESE
jgi:hypothetical protein